MTDGTHFFDLPVKIGTRIYKNIRQIETGQGNEYTID